MIKFHHKCASLKERKSCENNFEKNSRNEIAKSRTLNEMDYQLVLL